MKYKILIFLIIMTIPFIKVSANTTEDTLNNLSKNITALKTKVNNLNTLKKYPVGSIYISTSSTNPSSTLGGTWQAYGQGRTLIGAGSNGTTNYTNGNTGGSSNVTLSASNMPAHTHTMTAKGSVSSTYTGKSVSTVTGTTAIHEHNINAYTSNNEASKYGLNSSGGYGFGGRVIVDTVTATYTYTNSAGAHTHTLTPAGTVTSTFKGTSGTTSSKGSTSAFSVQNPYIVTYIWKRTA